jgi:hypothetical protein
LIPESAAPQTHLTLMVLARVANFFTNGDSTKSPVQDSRSDGAATMQKVEQSMADTAERVAEAEIDEEAVRPPYLHVGA